MRMLYSRDVQKYENLGVLGAGLLELGAKGPSCSRIKKVSLEFKGVGNLSSCHLLGTRFVPRAHFKICQDLVILFFAQRIVE